MSCQLSRDSQTCQSEHQTSSICQFAQIATSVKSRSARDFTVYHFVQNIVDQIILQKSPIGLVPKISRHIMCSIFYKIINNLLFAECFNFQMENYAAIGLQICRKIINVSPKQADESQCNVTFIFLRRHDTFETM